MAEIYSAEAHKIFSLLPWGQMSQHAPVNYDVAYLPSYPLSHRKPLLQHQAHHRILRPTRDPREAIDFVLVVSRPIRQFFDRHRMIIYCKLSAAP